MDLKPRITHTFDHKANMYSKPMANTIVRTGVPSHTMQIILSVFYMHVILQVSLGLHVQHNVFLKMTEFICNKYKL
jgi:hypothetical protein